MAIRRVLVPAALVLIGITLVLALAEIACRLLPVTSGLHPSIDTAHYPLRGYAPATSYSYSQGWLLSNAQRGTTNNYGHIAPHDFQADSKPVIVVGDSYVESLMNPYADTVQAQLGARLDGIPVYGLGLSGMSASDYIVMARLARDEFAPRAAVFVLTDGDFAESLQRRPGGYHLERRVASFLPLYLPRTPSRFVQRLRDAVGDIALYDYVRGNLKFSPSDVLSGLRASASGAASAKSPKRGASPADVAGVVRWFLTELPSATGVDPTCTVLLLDADRYSMYRRGAAEAPSTDGPQARRALIELGIAHGFHVIDLEPWFGRAYERDRLKLDHWPQDRHWNRRGHAVAAEAAASALRSGGGGIEGCGASGIARARP